MMRAGTQPAVVRAVALAAALLLVAASPAQAHGDATGAQEFLQHNLVTLGFVVVIVLAAAALLWLNRPRRRVPSSSAPAALDPSEQPAD